jgi:hypothetical protein
LCSVWVLVRPRLVGSRSTTPIIRTRIRIAALTYVAKIKTPQTLPLGKKQQTFQRALVGTSENDFFKSKGHEKIE